jgi:hypothetical protein
MHQDKFQELKAEIETRIEKIKNFRSDHERRHFEEDMLYKFFIEQLANQKSGRLLSYMQVAFLAELVLTTKQINFPRYYA